MNTVLLLPLDERPCNFDFPGKIFDGQGMRLLRPERLGKKKTPADGEEVARFLVENAPQATAAVLSLDTLLYGGLIPSRLHHLPEEVLEQRFQVLEKMKEANPAIRLFAYQCIMRCPT